MKQKISALFRKISSTKLVAGFAIVASVAVFGATSMAAAAPNYMDVEKPTAQRVCYKQLSDGWKKLGFRDLDHCLRYVSTEQPEDKETCQGGWWFVYGFNSLRQCYTYVDEHGGGYGATL
ncbi:MAG TPA: hypothetical protein VFZ48_02580 [Candidatus Saccharimonadales bacterium]